MKLPSTAPEFLELLDLGHKYFKIGLGQVAHFIAPDTGIMHEIWTFHIIARKRSIEYWVLHNMGYYTTLIL